MKTKEEKAQDTIRKRVSYKSLSATLRWLETKPTTLELLKAIYPMDKLRYSQRSSLNLLIKDYEDGKRETEGATRGLGNPVPVL